VIRKVIILRIVLSLKRYFLLTLSSQLHVCSHTLAANKIPTWIVGASKHIVRDRAGFMEFHRYLVGTQSVLVGNGSEEDILGVGTYQLLL